ncbi:MAG: TetR/AcrR family transcriptional regulator [Candidatus Wallbacteria bacterium]|nr:TetR/AcrR family transcriptional regulator [Candidatus Wallbacteria bacterium]
MSGKPEKKQRILNAALPVFAGKGYEKTTIDEIAHGADVSKGTVYTYFRSKEDLFDQLVKFWLLKLQKTIKEKIEPCRLDQKLGVLIISFIDFFRKNPGVFMIVEEYKLYSRRATSSLNEPINELFMLDPELLEIRQQEIRAGRIVDVSAENNVLFIMSVLTALLYREFFGNRKIEACDIEEIDLLLTHGLMKKKKV